MGLSMSERRRGVGVERFRHRGIGEPFLALAHEVALLGNEALALEQRPGDIARLDREALGATRAAKPCQRVNKGDPRALAGKFGINKEHVDFVGALEARETRDRATDDSNQCQSVRKSSRESVLVIRTRGPGRALVGIVVLRRQLFDARPKNLGAPFGVREDIGTQRDGAHRLNSQVAPALPSLTATPSSASSSRSLSEAAQSRRWRASSRSATIRSISAMRSGGAPKPCRAARLLTSRPRNSASARSSAAASDRARTSPWRACR